MKDGLQKRSPSIESAAVPKSFSNPLPGDCQWRTEEWPTDLHAHVLTIASFKYPAAIFWGSDLTLLYNDAWQAAGGIDEQGRPQRGSLSADAWQALQVALMGGTPQRISSEDILRDTFNHDEGTYQVLVSPLHSTGQSVEVRGVLAQLVTHTRTPRDQYQRKAAFRLKSFGEEKMDQNYDDAERQGDLDVASKAIDNVPLDEHPFFHRFAEMLPTGVAILDHEANAVFVNQIWYNMTTHKGPSQDFKSWPESIYTEDKRRVLDAYQDTFKSGKQLRTEFRSSAEGNPWRLLLLTPLGDENLQHVSLREYGGFICSIVDITSEKRAELTERKAANEAKERRIQQEKFMDMISHEIRNPLSAILHCIEDIDEAISTKDSVDVFAIREAVDTINLCVNHQKAIVNDVLSFSKLDSSMLNLSPNSCQPEAQMASSMRMFQPEMKKHKIKYDYIIDTSYVDQKVGWVMCDMPRISQVLVNLVSNAIKFTSRSAKKEISISVGCSEIRPTSYPPNVVYFAPDQDTYRLDATNASEWGNGETCYIMVAVKDTGIGISEESQKKLFARFRQATPKTEETFGGSGLGLAISRKLCHLHGGEIGVSAEEGAGSTFGFFFKVKKTGRPKDYDDAEQKDLTSKKVTRAEVLKQGNLDPEQAKNDEQPESLQRKIVKDTGDHKPNDDGSDVDGRFRTTDQVASEVPKEHTDGSVNAHRQWENKTERVDGSEAASKQARDAQERQASSSRGMVDSSDYRNKDDATHVLLVEDNMINQRIVARKLQTKGFKVTTANNGQDAVHAMQGLPQPSDGHGCTYDVILMDQDMPIMDGNAATKAIRRLRADGETKHVPIIGVSANTRDEQQDTMRDSGMDDVISKPYKIDDLVAKIRQHTSE
nr:sensor histidine kinase rcsc [Quercus suber]